MNEQDQEQHHQRQRYQDNGGSAVAAAAAAVAPLQREQDNNDNVFIDERIQVQQRHPPQHLPHDHNYRPRHVITSEAQHTKSLPSLPPINDDVITPQIADAYLAKTLNQLGIDERTKAIEDVHGVSKIINEEPTFIQSCLEKFDKEIASLQSSNVVSTSSSTNTGEVNSDVNVVDPDVVAAVGGTTCFLNKDAYNMAMAQNPDHVQSLRISFLRAESFHLQHAAIRMISYFDAKLDLFGPNLLAKDITIHDIEKINNGDGATATNQASNEGGATNTTNKDIECLNTGYIQLLPARDRSGRPIVCWIPGLIKDDQQITPESKSRCVWYMLMTALLDEETQKKGIVGLVYNNDGTVRHDDRICTWKAGHLLSVLPVRFVAMHYCYEAAQYRTLLGLLTTAFGAKTRTRLRPHHGTDAEVIYKLLTFGIPQDVLPFTANGKLKLNNHKTFLEQRRNFEKQRRQALLQILPTTIGVAGRSSVGITTSPNTTTADRGSIEFKLEEEEQKEMTKSSVAASSTSKDPTTSQSSAAVERVIVPSNIDILLGRGSQYQGHPGNARFHHIVQEYIDFYEQGDKFEKTVLAELVLSVVKHGKMKKQKSSDGEERPSPSPPSPPSRYDPRLSGEVSSTFDDAATSKPPSPIEGMYHQPEEPVGEGAARPPADGVDAPSSSPPALQPPPSARFLLRDEAGWMVVSDDIARNRVSRAFRNRRLASGTRTSPAAAKTPSPRMAAASSSSPFGHRPPEGCGDALGFGSGQRSRSSPPSLPPYPQYGSSTIATATGLPSIDPASQLPHSTSSGSFGLPMDEDDKDNQSSNKRQKFEQV